MAITISENHLYQIKTALSNLASYLDKKAETDQEAAEHLAETEETLNTLQSAEVDQIKAPEPKRQEAFLGVLERAQLAAKEHHLPEGYRFNRDDAV